MLEPSNTEHGKSVKLTRVLLLLPAVAFLAIATLNVSGVCVWTGSRITDAELLEMGPRVAFLSYAAAVRSEDADIILGEGHRVYPDFETFVVENPDCCHILRPGTTGWRAENEVGAWPRIYGRFRAYLRSRVDAGNGEVDGRLVVVSNCGRVSGEMWD